MCRIRGVIGTILICLCAGAGPVEPFEFGKEREWDFLNQAMSRGSLVKLETGKVHIRMAKKCRAIY